MAAREFERPLFAKARRLCLALPETAERESWGHPNFRAGKKVFCAFEAIGGRPSIAFKLDRAAVERTLKRRHFFATPYGRGTWVSLPADADVEWSEIAALIEQSYRFVATKGMLKVLDARGQ